MHAVECGLADQSLGFGGIAWHWRRLRVAQEVQDSAEVLRVSVDEDPAIPIVANLMPSRQQALQVTSALLHQGRARCLEDGSADVQINGGLGGQLRVDKALSLSLKETVLLAKLLVVVSYRPPTLRALLLNAGSFLVDPPACLLNVCLNLTELSSRVLLSVPPILPDLLDLALLLCHELVPHRKFLLLESLPSALRVAAQLLEFRLGLLEPSHETSSQIADHLLEVWIKVVIRSFSA
mmetsp:Transcript_64092/g.139423  ORF Transcript_64092/g.139423 Transcript_64092/m.139423 type:complete len:237 (-) Transcript_64092:348-1058(-)